MDYSLIRKMENLHLPELGVLTYFEKTQRDIPKEHNKAGQAIKGATKLFETKVAGTSFVEDKTVYEEIQQGDILSLMREPSNEHDPMAILICTADGKKLGYIPKDENTIIGNMIDAGKLISALVLDVVDHQKYLDISIEIYLND